MTTRLRHCKGLRVLNDILNGKNIKLVSSTILAFEKNRKTLPFKQEKPKKQSKSNKQKGSGSLKEKQVKALYNKDLLEKSCPEALLNSLAKQ